MGAGFQDTNLEGADLREIQNWRYLASIEGSNIHNVLNAPEGFVTWAMEVGTISEAGALGDLWTRAEAFRAKEEGHI